MRRDDPEYQALVNKRIDYCVELVKLSQGGAFILTTANDELDAIGAALSQRLSNPVFVQGHARNPWHGDPQSVLQQFLAAKDGVLVGSKSFWEGVDVPGAPLRLVVVAKLPFPNPNDPFIVARTARSDWHGVSYADMMTDLRQGIGRLIRSVNDRGAVAILDSRVWDKPYGARIRRQLMFPVTGKMEDCRYAIPKIVTFLKKGSNGTAP